jgi:hypothetical protein
MRPARVSASRISEGSTMTTFDDFHAPSVRLPANNAGRAIALRWLRGLLRVVTGFALFALVAVAAFAIRLWVYMPASFSMPAHGSEQVGTAPSRSAILPPWPGVPRRKAN